MNRPCPNKVLCINDNPFANLSSEGPEVFYYTAYGYCCDGQLLSARSVESQVAANDALDNLLIAECPDCNQPVTYCATAACPSGTQLTQVCTDTSQADADALAAERAAQMLPYCNDLGLLYSATCACPNGSNSHTVYSSVSQAQADADCGAIPLNCNRYLSVNQAQTCTVTCPDGTVFYYTVRAGEFSAPTQAQANLLAYSAACSRARQERICLGNLQTFCCYEDRLRATVTAYTTAPTVYWSLTSGALPTGLSLNPTGKIMAFSGTATADGTFTFTLRATDANGNYAERSYTVRVIKISADDTGMTETDLAPATVGVQYSNNFTYSGPTITNPVWSVIGGELPNGLSLDATIGELGGVATTIETNTFTIEVTGTIGTESVSCSREFTMRAVAAGTDVFAYFKCDEATPINQLDNSVDSFHMPLSVGVAGTSVAGKINTALRLGIGGGPGNSSWVSPTDPHWVVPHSFTVRFWYKAGAFPGFLNESILWTDDQWEIWRQDASMTEVYFYLNIRTSTGYEYVQSANFSRSVWHRITVWFEEGVGLGIKVDEDAPALSATTDPLYAPAASYLYLRGDNDLDDAIDEIAIWNRKLSNAEMLYDYNSGNGRTYPNIP